MSEWIDTTKENPMFPGTYQVCWIFSSGCSSQPHLDYMYFDGILWDAFDQEVTHWMPQPDFPKCYRSDTSERI